MVESVPDMAVSPSNQPSILGMPMLPLFNQLAISGIFVLPYFNQPAIPHTSCKTPHIHYEKQSQ
jgi:hypothetical protein